MEWNSIETAPRDRPFLAFNHDGEVGISKYIDGRLASRTHRLWAPTRHTSMALADGSTGLVLDEDYTKPREEWHNSWLLWTRGYKFVPTLWASLEQPELSDSAAGRKPASKA